MLVKTGVCGGILRFVCVNLTHSPSTIIDGDAGVDVYSPSDVTNTSKNRTFSFYLVNDKNTTLTGVNWTVEFGDGSSTSGNDSSVSESVQINVSHNYSRGGDYVVNFTAVSSGISDAEKLSIKFGTRANQLQTIYSNVSERTFEFDIYNDIVDMVYNVGWNCTDGISSIYVTNLTGSQHLFDYIAHNYSSAGDKTFTCTAVSLDGSESKTITFTIEGLEIQDYDILSTNISTRVVSFDVRNYFEPMEANISISSDGSSFSTLANLSTDEEVMVFAEVNYSTDGAKTFSADALSDHYSNSYTESFKLEGVSIENYQRTDKNYTTKVLVFDVRNVWHDGLVNWSISSPNIDNAPFN